MTNFPGPDHRPPGGWPPPPAVPPGYGPPPTTPWSPPSTGHPPGYDWGPPSPGPYPPTGYPPPAPGYPPPRKKSKALLFSVIAGVVAVAVTATGIGLYVIHRNSDPVKIRNLVGNFSAAVYGGDPHQMVQYMCAEGAQSFLDNIEDPDSPAASETPPKFEVSDVQVKGDVASAKLTFEPRGVQTMYFRKEDKIWKVCAAAEDQM